MSAPIERKRPLLFVAGLVVALSVTLVSFEWRTPYVEPALPEAKQDTEEVLWIPVTLPEVRPKLERPAPPQSSPDVARQDFKVVSEEQASDVETPSIPDAMEPPQEALVNLLEAEVEDEPKVWRFSEVQPEYCAGEAAMLAFLHKELEYPEIPRSNGVSGTVHIQFVVGKDGKARDAKVLRPIDPWLDAEALRVAKMLDCFVPGSQGGRAVDVFFILPVKFKLN